MSNIAFTGNLAQIYSTPTVFLTNTFHNVKVMQNIKCLFVPVAVLSLPLLSLSFIFFTLYKISVFASLISKLLSLSLFLVIILSVFPTFQPFPFKEISSLNSHSN